MDDDHTYEAWDLESLSDLPNYRQAIVDNFRPYLRGDGTEIGAGTGTFSRFLLDHVERLELVEPAPNLARQLDEDFAGSAGVHTVTKTLEDYLAEAPAASRDCVVLVNVLEHIEDDKVALAGLFRLLRPGGHLLVFVPALPWLFSAMDTALGHYRRYLKGELAGRVEGAGFEMVKVRYFDVLGVAPWWLVYTLGGNVRFNRNMARLYDRLFTPVSRALEAVVPPPLGKNLVLIAEKPEGPR